MPECTIRCQNFADKILECSQRNTHEIGQAKLTPLFLSSKYRFEVEAMPTGTLLGKKTHQWPLENINNRLTLE